MSQLLGSFRKTLQKKYPERNLFPVTPKQAKSIPLTPIPPTTTPTPPPPPTSSPLTYTKLDDNGNPVLDENGKPIILLKKKVEEVKEWRAMNNYEKLKYEEYLVKKRLADPEDDRDPHYDPSLLNAKTPQQKMAVEEMKQLLDKVEKLLPEKPKITQEELIRLYHINQDTPIPSKYNPMEGFQRITDMSYQEALYSPSSPFLPFGRFFDWIAKGYRQLIFINYKRRGDHNLRLLEEKWKSIIKYDMTDRVFDYQKKCLQEQLEAEAAKNLKRPARPKIAKKSVAQPVKQVVKKEEEFKEAGLITSWFYHYWRRKRNFRRSLARFRLFVTKFVTDNEYRTFPTPSNQKEIMEEAERERTKQKEEEERLKRNHKFGIEEKEGEDKITHNFDKAMIRGAVRPVDLQISPPYDPFVLSERPLSVEDALNLAVTEKGGSDLMGIYNTTASGVENNDPLKGGSELLQQRLFGAGDAAAEVVTYFGTAKPDELFDEQHVEDMIREVEEKRDKLEKMTEQEIELEEHNESPLLQATFFGNTPVEEFISAASLDSMQLQAKMMNITDDKEGRKKLAEIVGMHMKKEWEMINQHRAEENEDNPLTEMEWISRMLKGQRMEDSSNAAESIERWIRAQTDFHSANSLYTPISHVFMEKVVSEQATTPLRVPVHLEYDVEFIIHQELNIIDHYLDVINEEFMLHTDVKDADASVEFLGERGLKIVEAVKKYTADFESDPEDALIKHVGKTWYREQVDTWEERWLVLSALEYQMFKHHNTVPFWMEIERKLFPKPIDMGIPGEEERRNLRQSIADEQMAEAGVKLTPVDDKILNDLLNGETMQSAAAALEPPAFYHNEEDPKWLWRHNWNNSFVNISSLSIFILLKQKKQLY
eukprot:TRINITY_DN2557_c0_g1_i2.p1 TRINITY_DN2557_c0_g1~~TRINITY_DN2557_c0_g1_i2.p1  ORF type:complete len:878 (+),score=270.83 TRINITY_DN2557_c0_g1_i2:90-2723(+)